MTFTAQMRLTITLYIIGALVTTGIVAYAKGMSDQRVQTPAPVYNVVVEEDGSGVQYIGDVEVATFPEGTFFWDCRIMGNKRCGAAL